MTITTTTVTHDIDGNDVATSWSVPISIVDKTTVSVKHEDSSGVFSDLVQDTDFTVTDILDATFTLSSVGFTLATGEKLHVVTEESYIQSEDLNAASNYPSSAIEAMCDKLTRLAQLLSAKIELCLHLNLGKGTNFSALLPDPVADKFLKFNSSGDGIDTSEATTVVVTNADAVANADNVEQATTVANADNVEQATTVTNATSATAITNADTVTSADNVEQATNVGQATDVVEAATVTNATNVNLVKFKCSIFSYYGATTPRTVKITGGRYLVKDKVVYTNSDVISPEISPASGNTRYYLYLDYSSISNSGDIFIAGNLYWSSTAPTYNSSYTGWYNGDDRCIFCAVTNGVGDDILSFYHDGGKYVQLGKRFRVANDITAGSYTAVDVSGIVPKFSTLCKIAFDWDYVDTVATFMYRVNGATDDVYLMKINASGQHKSINTDIYTDSGQVIEIKAGGNNTFYASVLGWFFPAGM